GCVFYEMLTGQQAFGGPTVTDSIAGLIHKEPAWDLLPVATPESVRRVLRRCLQKDAKRRLRDIADAVSDLEDVSPSAAANSAALVSVPASRAPTGSRLLWSSVAGVLIVGAFFLGSFWRARQRPVEPKWIGERLNGSAIAFNPQPSPDGQTLAF